MMEKICVRHFDLVLLKLDSTVKLQTGLLGTFFNEKKKFNQYFKLTFYQGFDPKQNA